MANAGVELGDINPINPIFNGLIDANQPDGLAATAFNIEPLNQSIINNEANLTGDPTIPEDNKQVNATNLRDALQAFGQAFQANRANNQRYKNVVNAGLNTIKSLINEIGVLINQISEEIRRLRALEGGPDGAEQLRRRIAQLVAQRNALTNVIDQSSAVLTTLVDGGNLRGAVNLNPRELAIELSKIINGLTLERDKSTNILAANDAAPLDTPVIEDRGVVPGPGPRGGKLKRKTKRHQNNSKKTNKKKSKKTAKRGKKQKGGYMYGRKSKRSNSRTNSRSNSTSASSSSRK
jgi:hypothetical protein